MIKQENSTPLQNVKDKKKQGEFVIASVSHRDAERSKISIMIFTFFIALSHRHLVLSSIKTFKGFSPASKA